MQACGDDVEDTPRAIGRRAAGDLGDEGQRVALVEHTQLTAPVVAIGRVEVDAALQQVAMKIGHERANVTRRDPPSLRVVSRLYRVHPGLRPRRPVGLVALVDGEHRRLLRHAQVFARKEVLSAGRVEREAVHRVTVRVDERGRRAIDDVAGSDLLAAGAEDVLGHDAVGLSSTVDGENRANGHIHVDVAGAVEGVEADDIVARAVGGDLDDLVLLFARHRGDAAGPSQHLDEGVVGDAVELLHVLALHVHVTRLAPELNQAGAPDLRRNQLADDTDLGHQPRELAARVRVQVLLTEHVLSEGNAEVDRL